MIINELPSPKHGDEGNDHAMMGSHREGEATETGDVEQESDRCGTYSLTSSKLVQLKNLNDYMDSVQDQCWPSQRRLLS